MDHGIAELIKKNIKETSRRRVGSCGAPAFDELQKLQNRAARIVTNSPYDTSAMPLMKSLSWLSIRELIDFDTSNKVYKSVSALAPNYLRNIFQKVSEATNRQLRNSKKLTLDYHY